MTDILKGLNPSQHQAVEHFSGPLLVLAGAGSGKTRVLTHRVAHIMASGVDGHKILAVTFTNKAAKEMQARIEKLIQGNPTLGGGMPAIGTFHSICVRILRKEIEFLDQGFSKNFVIFDTDDAKSLLKIIMKEQRIDEKEFKVKAIQSHISAMKNLLAEPEDHFDNLGMLHNRFAKVVMQIFPIYQKRLIEHNALDFDDLLQKVVQVWEHRPEILEEYQNKWQYVLVDEYQDTNFVQYRFIRLLTDIHKNLCVVGDDHQSIYSFRGADFRNILNFESDYPEAKVVKLEQNYRSSANILNNANSLISHNETGREKNLWTESDPGDPITVQEVFDEKSEGKFIADKIRDLHQKAQIALSNIAILYRMNAQSRALEEALMRNQIPYQIVGGVRFFDRKEIKDIIAYLRLIFNSKDDVSFLRVINTPSRKIGPATLEVLKNYSQEYQLSLFEVLGYIDDINELSKSKKLALRNFRDQIKDLKQVAQEKPISFLLDELIEKIQFFKWLDDGTNEGEARIQNVRELFSVAGRYDMAEDSLAAFLEGVALISDVDQMQNQETVTLMTVHASKGLEFENVFLPGWEENIFPSSSSQFSNEQLEEERRLAYVAITRAEKRCFISHAKQRMLFGQRDFTAPSKFLSELDKECIERNESIEQNLAFGSTRRTVNFDHPLLQRAPKNKKEAVFGVADNETKYKTGDKIKHAEFGEGTILMIAGDVISAAFKGHGVKKIVASIAPIEKI